MAKLDQYREAVQQVLAQHAQIKSAYGDIERQTLFDVECDHYQVLNASWKNRRRVFGCLIHVDIKGDKIWIQYDRTEVRVANELVESGIPKQDIVLA